MHVIDQILLHRRVFLSVIVKGIVQRKLRWVEIGINRQSSVGALDIPF